MIETLQHELIELGTRPGWALTLAIALSVLGVVLLCLLSHLVARRWLPRLVGLAMQFARDDREGQDLSRRLGRRFSLLGPAVVLYASAGLFRLPGIAASHTFALVVERIALAAMILLVTLVLVLLLDIFVHRYRVLELGKTLPLKSFTQVIKLVLLLIAAVLILSTLLDKSPAGFFTGLGALSAVVIFVFREPILGLVASVKIASTHLIRLGDWIEMPKFGADGNVTDISLTTVEVQNWDKTFVSVPTYAFLGDAVKNWRGMTESGGRRIKRSIHLDMGSVRFCDSELRERLRRLPYVGEYLDEIAADGAGGPTDENPAVSSFLRERTCTNVGAFRAYLTGYLRHHPSIHRDLTFLVRHLQPTERGLPIEIYVFSKDQEWANYEVIQADIVDHVIAIVPEFDLRIFQLPAGQQFHLDVRKTQSLA